MDIGFGHITFKQSQICKEENGKQGKVHRLRKYKEDIREFGTKKRIREFFILR